MWNGVSGSGVCHGSRKRRTRSPAPGANPSGVSSATAANAALAAEPIVGGVLDFGSGVESGFANGREVTVRAKKEDGAVKEFKARLRLDTGTGHYVLKKKSDQS